MMMSRHSKLLKITEVLTTKNIWQILVIVMGNADNSNNIKNLIIHMYITDLISCKVIESDNSSNYNV